MISLYQNSAKQGKLLSHKQSLSLEKRKRFLHPEMDKYRQGLKVYGLTALKMYNKNEQKMYKSIYETVDT